MSAMQHLLRLRKHRLFKVLVALSLFAIICTTVTSLLQYENVFSRGYDYDQLPDAPLFVIYFYRQFFDYLETPLARCESLARFGRVAAWHEPQLCLSAPFSLATRPDCLVYSFQHAKSRDNYLAFEEGVARLGCEVHVFDLDGGLGQAVRGAVGDGSVTWHVVGGRPEHEKFSSLADVVRRLGHQQRTIHYMRIYVDFDADRRPRMNLFLSQLQFLVHGELLLFKNQVEQLQLQLALRPASLKPATTQSYQRVWEVFDQLHRAGFLIVSSRVANRVVWLPGLTRAVGARYNVLWAKDMPTRARRSGATNDTAEAPLAADMRPSW